MKKIKPVHYYDELFQANYWFYLGTDISETGRHLAKHWGCDPDIVNEGLLGKTIEFKNGKSRCIIIWTKMPLSNKLIYPTLAHECVHAAGMALSLCGVYADFTSDETMAHYVGLLMKKAMQL